VLLSKAFENHLPSCFTAEAQRSCLCYNFLPCSVQASLVYGFMAFSRV
jgi:hypothetical protein